MLTRLFPENNATIIFRQGRVGDCYLLTGIDCILHAGPKGYDILKSMFTEVDTGVFVRIKRSVYSKNLDLTAIADKYQYFYDPLTNEDVFFLDHKRLEAIDQTTIGVWSNSLAVKILEHLSSYYYYIGRTHSNPNSTRLYPPQGKRSRLDSVEAHDADIRFKNEWVLAETVFFSKLLNVSAHRVDDIQEIIRMKAIDAELPVYVSMQYGKERHALRIKHLEPCSHCVGGYAFTLVNPWDNRLEEYYSLEQMITRKSKFSIFLVEEEKYTLLRFLLHSSTTIGKEIFSDPALLKLVIQLRKLDGILLTPKDIENFVLIYNRNKDVLVKFNELPLFEQKKILTNLLSIKDETNDKKRMTLLGLLEIYWENKIQILLAGNSTPPEEPIRSYASVTKHGLFTKQDHYLSKRSNGHATQIASPLSH